MKPPHATRRRALVALIGLVIGVEALAADDQRASFGFTLEVDGEGFFMNPVLESVTVTAVAAGSPAFAAGIAVKDQILEADGHLVKGTRARDFEPVLRKQVGQPLRLRLKRPGGDEYVVTLVGVARPAKP